MTEVTCIADSTHLRLRAAKAGEKGGTFLVRFGNATPLKLCITSCRMSPARRPSSLGESCCQLSMHTLDQNTTSAADQQRGCHSQYSNELHIEGCCFKPNGFPRNLAKARAPRKSDLGGLTCWASTLGGHSCRRLLELENTFSLSMKEIGTV
jgi:hypothetical protein